MGTVIAIDGPAGSGKSTVARAVAERLQLDYLDTGAMYRSVAFASLRAGIDLRDADAVAALARRLSISVGDQVLVDGVDATEAIRGPEVTGVVSVVAAHPGVRAVLVARQRAWVHDHGGGVVEGRDIGTVVFPDAALKVYLTAAEDTRAGRRRKDSGDAVAAEVARRDAIDTGRSTSPLRVAHDAVVIDTTDLAVDAVVALVLERVEA